MRSITARSLGPRLAFGAVLIAVLVALVGWGTGATHASPAKHASPATNPLAPPHPAPSASAYAVTPSKAGGDVYTDGLSAYSITFPGRPDVRPLAISGTNRLANIAGYSGPSSIVLIARGEVRDSSPDLRGELMGWLQTITVTGSIGASSYQLDGLPAAQAQFTEGTVQGQTIVANNGVTFYQLIAVGGTAHQRQAFFKSFRLI